MTAFNNVTNDNKEKNVYEIQVITDGDRETHFVPKGVDPTPAIEWMLASRKAEGWLGFDFETSATWASDKFAYATSMQVGTTTVAVLLDPWDKDHRAAMRRVLNDPSYRIVAHNAGFDVLYAVRIGIFDSVAAAYERLDDTLVYARLLAAGDFIALDLKSLTAALCGADAVSKDAKDALKKVQAKMGTKGVATSFWSPYKTVAVDAEGNVTGDPRKDNTWALIKRDVPEWISYCAADVFDAALLAETIAPMVTDLYPEQVLKEHRVERIVCEMTHRGMAFNKDRAVGLLKEAHGRRDVAAEGLKALGVDVSEPKTLVKTASGAETSLNREELVAFAIRKETDANGNKIDVPRKRTKDGAWAFEMDKGSLKKYEKLGSKLAPLYRDWKKADKEIRTYLEPYLKCRPKRIHADISTGAARTGRMTAAKPNVQNVPKTVKPCFAADPGMTLISCDFSSVEMRVAAAITGDPELVGMYTEPLPEGATERQKRERDPYWQIAWQVWGDDATEDDRKLAKIIVLGNMYGGGAPALAANADIPVATASDILAGYKKRFAQLKEWWNDTMTDRVRSGIPHWTLETGRFQTTDPTRAWAGFNLMVQGTARDLLLDALFRCEDAGFGEFMLLPIHDEILFQVPVDQAEDMAGQIAEAMGTVFMGVPITAEAKVLGPVWIEKTDKPKSTDADAA